MVIGVCRLISSLALARFSTSAKAKLFTSLIFPFSSFLPQAATKCVSASYVLHQVRRTKKVRFEDLIVENRCNATNENLNTTIDYLITELMLLTTSLSLTLVCLTSFATFSHLVHNLPQQSNSRLASSSTSSSSFSAPLALFNLFLRPPLFFLLTITSFLLILLLIWFRFLTSQQGRVSVPMGKSRSSLPSGLLRPGSTQQILKNISTVRIPSLGSRPCLLSSPVSCFHRTWGPPARYKLTT